MEYTHKFDEKTGICTITVTGYHQRPLDSIILIKVIIGLCHENKFKKFFVDMRQAEIGTTTKDSFITSSIPLQYEDELKQAKLAYLYADDLENHKFLEYLAIKKGYNTCIFNDYDRAINWLKADLKSDKRNQ